MSLSGFEMRQPEHLLHPYHNNLPFKNVNPMPPEQQRARRQRKMELSFSIHNPTYNVSTSRVALTTGLYMMGLGVGSVFASPTAILFGKRPVYLFSAILFICTSVWCALSPSYVSLLVARIFQGISVSPVECLPSATVAEIFFLHERAYRLGIYTLLLLGGKNLVPLVSAAIIQSLGWRWVFW